MLTILLLTLRDWIVDLLTGGEWSRLRGKQSPCKPWRMFWIKEWIETAVRNEDECSIS